MDFSNEHKEWIENITGIEMDDCEPVYTNAGRRPQHKHRNDNTCSFMSSNTFDCYHNYSFFKYIGLIIICNSYYSMVITIYYLILRMYIIFTI